MKKNILKKVLPYKLRNATMALAATVAGMTTTSCEKEDDILPDEPKKEQIIPTKEINLNLYLDKNDIGTQEKPNDSDKILDKEYMINLVKQPDVKYVFIRLGGRWDNADERHAQALRKILEPIVEEEAEKVFGSGDFVKLGFPRGVMSKNENTRADSLYLVKRGYSFNGR